MRTTVQPGWLLALVVLLAGCWQDNDAPEEQPLSHFKCYAADGEPVELAERLWLEDQFHVEKDVEVLGVRFFCNPVEKRRGEEPHPAQLDEDHLTCYQIRDEQRFWAEVDARNQFGDQRYKIYDDQLLCVPTFKKAFEPVPPGTRDCPGGLHCCCNQIGGTLWPDCDPGFECRSNVNTAGPNDYINTCVPAGSPANRPIQLNPSQPPFCRP